MTEQGDKPVVTQAVNAKDEWIAFQSWWKRTIPHEHVPSPTSHFFDVWMGSARHREALSSELEAIAYLHTLHMEGGQTYERLTTFDGTDPDDDSATAFGVPGRDYSEEYVVTTTPLYAALSASEGRDVGREALDRSWPDCLDPNAAHNRRPKRYRKTALIEAVQWFKDGDHPAVRMSDDIREAMVAGHAVPWIETLEGGHIVTPGDWIATGMKGEHWSIKPDVFAATYEEALSTPPAPEHHGERK